MAALTFLDGFWRDDTGLVNDDGRFPTPIQDLLDVAIQAYLKDREDRRGPVGEPTWYRSLKLDISVRRPRIWRQPDVQQTLTELLGWTTGDEWIINVSRTSRSDRPRQSRLSVDPIANDVALFSGGLDATAGIALRMAQGRNVIAVGVATNSTMRGYQTRTYRALTHGTKGRVRYVQVPLESRTGSRHDEPSRRTRGFVFLAVGVAAALAVEQQSLLILENGVGAINLPYTAAQWGAMTSRSAHPRTLELMERLCRLTLDKDMSIENPHLFETKGQMCGRLPEWAREAVASSESCDNAAAGRGRLDRRCGECASCLLRRVSLHAAGRSHWDERPYRADRCGGREDRDRTPEMLWQAANLDQAMQQPGGLAAAYPDLRYVPDVFSREQELAGLFSTYVSEWRRYTDPRVISFLGNQPR